MNTKTYQPVQSGRVCADLVVTMMTCCVGLPAARTPTSTAVGGLDGNVEEEEEENRDKAMTDDVLAIGRGAAL
jgi:hypothetical protein